MGKEMKKRGRPKKAIDSPAVDKMVKMPERKKGGIPRLPPDSAPNVVIRGIIGNIWELLANRERNIHGGTGIIK